MSDINIDRCITEINRVKENVDNCFTLCNAKGSTYVEQNRTTSELINKIQAIPIATGGGSGEPIPFTSPFLIMINTDITQDWTDCAEYDFSNIGVNWNGFTCFSATNPGWTSIYKLSSTHCCISSLIIEEANEPEITGKWVVACGTHRFRYEINGNNIIFTREPYNEGGYLINTEYPAFHGIFEMMSAVSMQSTDTPEDIAENWARYFELIHIY